jgi:hypothetical protein
VGVVKGGWQGGRKGEEGQLGSAARGEGECELQAPFRGAEGGCPQVHRSRLPKRCIYIHQEQRWVYRPHLSGVGLLGDVSYEGGHILLHMVVNGPPAAVASEQTRLVRLAIAWRGGGGA